MDKGTLKDILHHFRSYSYAAKMGDEFLEGAQPVYSERRRQVNRWDATRYVRIVTAVSGAIEDVLTDEQAEVIRYKYLIKNPQTFEAIAQTMDRGERTVRKRHNQAMYKLGIALSTFDTDPEITPFEHMFTDPDDDNVPENDR